MLSLQEGTRIYYTGDMANRDGHGVITRVDVSPKWGTTLWIKLDDDRPEFSVSPSNFSEKYEGHGGTRFVTEAAYELYRENQIADMKRRYREIKIAE